jgi:protein-tyrosine phosphatase
MTEKNIKDKTAKIENYFLKKSPLKNKKFAEKIKIFGEDEALSEYNKITTRIFLGNYDAAKNKSFFKKHNIKGVLNCSKEIPNFFKDTDIEYLRIPIDDSLKDIDIDKFYDYLPLISEFIYKYADIAKQNILIHCAQGRQRSFSAVVAYLISKKNMSLKKATDYVLKKRKEGLHYGTSFNFSKALIKFEENNLAECKKSKLKL